MISEKLDSYTDELTGAKNRRFLSNFADLEVRRSLRYSNSFSIILFDIDNFKEINDLYGHLEGDKVLKELSTYIMQNLRESDVLIRYGGDEFIIYLSNTDFEKAKLVAEKILSGLSSRKIAGRTITLSMGIASFPRDGKTWTEIFKKADVALYRSKRRGKARVSWVEEVEAVPVIPTSQFVDRMEERHRLLSSLNGDQKIFIVRGGVGIGKTRLVKETLKKIEGVHFLMGVAYGALSEVPFSLAKDLIKYVYNNYRLELKEALNTLDKFEMKAFSAILPEISKESAQIQLDKYKLYDTFLKILKNLAVDRRAIVFIDDLQWADESSVELFYYVIKNSTDSIKFYATFRIEDYIKDYIENLLTQFTRERLAAFLELGPFSYSASAEFITAILQEETSKEVFDFLHTKSGGNPFFIEELIKELYERGTLVYTGKGWVLKETEGISVPSTIAQVIKKKIHEVEGDKVLEVAACIGHEFSPMVIEGVLGMDLGEVYDSIEKGIKKGLLDESGSDLFSFKEDIVRELILNGISQGKRRYYHQRIAQWIEAHKGLVSNAEELITYHAYKGVDTERVLQYAPLVAARAASNFAYEEAKRFWLYYFEFQTDGSKYLEETLKFIDCLLVKGDLEFAKDFLLKTQEKFPSQVCPEFYSKLSDVYLELGQYAEALKYIEKSIELVDVSRLNITEITHTDAKHELPLYRYYIQKGWILIKLGRFKDAQVVLSQAELNKQYLSKYWEGTLYNVLGVLNNEISTPDDAISYYEKAIEIRKSINDYKGLAGSYIDIAIVYHDMGEMDKAIYYYEEAKKIYQQMGYKNGLTTAYIDIGMYYFGRRRYEEAIKNFQNAYHEASLIGSKDSMCLALNNIGSVLRVTKRHIEAEVFYRRALEIAEEINSTEHIIVIYRNLARNYLESRKDLDKAEEWLRKALDLVEGRGLDSSSLIVYLVGTDFYLEKGDFEKAEELLEKLAPALEQKRFSNFQAWILLRKAKYHLLRDERVEGGKILSKIWQDFKKEGEKDPDSIVSYFEVLLDIFIAIKNKSGSKKILEKLENLYKKYEFYEDLSVMPHLQEIVESL